VEDRRDDVVVDAGRPGRVRIPPVDRGTGGGQQVKLCEGLVRPQRRLKMRQTEIDARKTALSDIATRLRNLKNAAADLKSPTLWLDTQSVDVNDSTKIAATRTGPAATGAYQVSVTSLASAYQRWYTYTPPAADTTIDIGGRPYSIAAGADISVVANTINSDAQGKVYASAVTNADGSKSLALSSRKTGKDVTNDFSVGGAGAADFVHIAGKYHQGTNAEGFVGGQVLDSATNIVADMIPGVTFTLKALTGGSPLTVNVGNPAPDKAAISAKVKAFVDQYNSTVDFIRGKVNEKKVADPQTTADYQKGVLYGDTALQGLLSSMRIAITNEYVGTNPDSMDQLSELGISTGKAIGSGTLNQDSIAGKLSFDQTKFEEALAASTPDVRKLLGGDTSVDGFAHALDGLLSPVVSAGGTIDETIKIQDARKKTLTDQIRRMDDMIARKQEMMKLQFAAMEQALARSQSQGNWLAGQLNALNNGR
jgi:flagellar hook-associated protein 2